MSDLLAHLNAWAGVGALVAAALALAALLWAWQLHRRVRVVTPDMRRFVREMEGKSFEAAVSGLLASLQSSTERLTTLEQHAEQTDRVLRRSVQKVGCVRYDADDEIGGALSFALALLDGNLNGLLLTSIHSFRECRLYMRPVAEGRCALPLIPEEEQALEEAKRHGESGEQPQTTVQPAAHGGRMTRSRRR